jgi:hypothetical protein
MHPLTQHPGEKFAHRGAALAGSFRPHPAINGGIRGYQVRT